MSASSYRRYQASTLGGADRIPSHWQQDPLKRLYVVKLGKMVTPSDEADIRATFPYLRSANVQDGYLQLDGVKQMWFSDTEAMDLSLLGGDLVVCEGGDAGRSAVLPHDLNGYGFQNSVNRVRSINPDRASTNYLGYWLKHLKQNGYIEVLCNRSTIAHLTADKLGAIRMPCPPGDEQRAIAAFLDREKAKIDALVAEQERLLALLAEKRQAVISRVVTQGLDPSVPMKDGGLEWLGRVPEHWKIAGIGYYASVENGSTPSRGDLGYWDDGDISWVGSGEVNQYVVTEPTEHITARAVRECSLRVLPEGAVLVGLIGQGRTRAMSALLGIPAAINQNVAAVTTKEGLMPAYLHFSLQAAYEFMRECARGGNQAALNCEILKAFRIAIPPVDEQESIVRYLERVHASTARLMAECETSIGLLRERRAALISAAVTGRIDVRGLVPTVEPAREAA